MASQGWDRQGIRQGNRTHRAVQLLLCHGHLDDSVVNGEHAMGDCAVEEIAFPWHALGGGIFGKFLFLLLLLLFLLLLLLMLIFPGTQRRRG